LFVLVKKNQHVYRLGRQTTSLGAVTMFLEVEKHLSELTDVVGIPKYFLSKATISGYSVASVFHHSSASK